MAAIVVGTGAGVWPGAAVAGAPGAVYSNTNATPANFVRVHYRHADGTIEEGPLVATGGVGSLAAPPFGFPVLDSVNAIARTEDGRLVFAVNGGSNSVSSFRVVGSNDGLVLADHEPSRGTLPISVAVTSVGVTRTILYVLNEGTLGLPPVPGTIVGTIAGFSVDPSGAMTPIPGAVYPVSDPIASQVGFDATGTVLTISLRGTNRIGMYRLDPSTGLLGPERIFAATGTGLPFGFEYTKRNQLVFANVGNELTNSTASSYDFDKAGGNLTPVDVESTRGGAACWVAITNDQRYAYITNTITNTIARYRITAGGELVFLGLTPSRDASLDVDTSHDGKYLYALSSQFTLATGFGSSKVEAYRIEDDGDLTLIDSSGFLPFSGATGIAAW
jgi:6-phosphogluconolactonase (cycloisomerase 2 family)